jgi:hypothetical protein
VCPPDHRIFRSGCRTPARADEHDQADLHRSRRGCGLSPPVRRTRRPHRGAGRGIIVDYGADGEPVGVEVLAVRREGWHGRTQLYLRGLVEVSRSAARGGRIGLLLVGLPVHFV